MFVNGALGSRFNQMSSYQYMKSHCGDKTVVRSSYIHNGISYTGKTPSLYWIRAQVVSFYWLFTIFFGCSRISYLHNGITFNGKTASLYWIRAQVVSFYWLFTNCYSPDCFIVKHCMVFKLIWMSQNVIKHHYRCSLVICLQDTHVGKHLSASSKLRAFLFTFLIMKWWTLKIYTLDVTVGSFIC